MADSIFNWLVLALCLAASFLLSGMEAGVFALNRLRVRRLARAGKPSAKLLNGFLEKPEKFLWTILVGNTLANFLILGWMLAKLHEWFLGQHGFDRGAFSPSSFFCFTRFSICCRKCCSARIRIQLCLSAARVFRFVNFMLSPLVLIVEGRVADDFALDGRTGVHRPAVRQPRGDARGDAGIRAGAHDDEHAMVNRVLDLQNFTVGQIATPLAEIVGGRGANAVARGALRWRGKKIFRACRSGKCATAGGASPDCSMSARCCSATIWIWRNPRRRT